MITTLKSRKKRGIVVRRRFGSRSTEMKVGKIKKKKKKGDDEGGN